MYGLSQIARRARQWRADHKRAAMANALMNLPPELRKDIGWPVVKDQPTVGSFRGSLDARRMP